jgi:NAD(P)-dependent dehydrogenase (short-subunit alcohol dehydrogenase family)
MQWKPLHDQVVVITGASGGLGRCAALHMAGRGARVAGTARRVEALESLAREIEAAGGEALVVAGDVTDLESMKEVARRVVERFGRIDTWINGAAVFIHGKVEDIPSEDFRRVIDVNLVGVINGTKAALEVMERQGEGHILQISSILAVHGAPLLSPYAAAKAGIEGFSDSLRAELWPKRIRVSTLYVPMVDTPIYEHARSYTGTIPKPPPPVLDPEVAARKIARLVERPRHAETFGFFGDAYLIASRVLPSRWTDALLHKFAGFTRTDIPSTTDNLDAPIDGEPPRIRAGWAEEGWKGWTLRELMEVVPALTIGGAFSVGVLAGVVSRRLTPRGRGRAAR